VFVDNQHGIQQRGQDFDKKFVTLYLKGYTAKRMTDEFPEKSWTKHSLNKLLKKLWDTGTAARRPGSGRPRSEKKIASMLKGDMQRFFTKLIKKSSFYVLTAI